MAPPGAQAQAGIGPDGSAYDLCGPQEAPAVVLVHGLGLNRAIWEDMVGALSPDFRVLRYDMLGHGQTPAPRQTPELALLARQLADLLDHLHIGAAAVVGFSLGGMIARRFAQDYPARCLGLAILHSPHRRSPKAQAAILERVAQARTEGPAATVEAALARWFSDDYRKASPQVMDRVRAWVLANDATRYPQFYGVFANGVEEIIAPQPPIRCPTLVMTGDADHGNGPAMAHAIAAEIEGAQTVILPGLRHMALMEDPHSTNAAVSGFLRKALGRG